MNESYSHKSEIQMLKSSSINGSKFIKFTPFGVVCEYQSVDKKKILQLSNQIHTLL